MEYRHVILSGCSGGGKSTLLAELARRGFAVVEEPGRRIVEQELRSDGGALPWVDLAAFARRALDLAAEDRRRMSGASGWVVFDRGLVDAAVALQHATGEPAATFLAGSSAITRSSSSPRPGRESTSTTPRASTALPTPSPSTTASRWPMPTSAIRRSSCLRRVSRKGRSLWRGRWGEK